MSKVLDFSVLNEEITRGNVLSMAEAIAFSETQYLIGYIGTKMQKLHNNVYWDIAYKNDVNHILSDGYDLVQEGALFLCEHYGKHLNDIIGYSKKGKKITVKVACIRKMEKLINLRSRDFYRNISLEALTPASEPSVELQEDFEQDYTVVDSIIESLNLTDNMKTALQCRMAGLSYPEIGKILERAQATVFEYFVKMRQRYSAIYAKI